MTCHEIEPELIGYHFAEVDEETRDRLERHLLECGACLRAYLELKRAIETSEAAPAPSDAARARLRRAVARELGHEAKWSWWERPLALALAASIVLVAGSATRKLTSTPVAPPHALSAGRR